MTNKKHTSPLAAVQELAVLTGAVAIIAAAVYFFLVPSHASVSSISGLGIVLANFVPLPLSAITMILNVVLLIIGFLTCGREFGAKTVYTSILLPLFLALLERLFPGKFEFTSYRDSFDYIYTVEELAELHGKKLQAKRNHCNRFEAEHPDFKTQRVTPETIPLCREMTEKWYEAHDWNEKIEYEKIAIARAFDCFSETGMDGLLLVENGEVLAFSLGARMNERYYDVCFEKAFSAINGAYAMINREFSRMIAEKYPAVAYLNREDDMGEPGLRKAKESYQPTLLLEKFTADWKEKI